MSKLELKIGDLVRFNSGGPVGKIVSSPKKITVRWPDDDEEGNAQYSSSPVVCFEKVSVDV